MGELTNTVMGLQDNPFSWILYGTDVLENALGGHLSCGNHKAINHPQ